MGESKQARVAVFLFCAVGAIVMLVSHFLTVVGPTKLFWWYPYADPALINALFFSVMAARSLRRLKQ